MNLRFKLVWFIGFIFISISFLSPCNAGIQANTATDDIDNLKQSDWWIQVQKNLQAQEYHISRQKTSHPTNAQQIYQAPNRKQGLRTYFSAQGIRIVRRTEQNPSWQVDLKLEAVGREGKTARCLPEADFVIQGPRIEYHRGAVIEWYVNRSDGLEQGFTIERKIEGDGDLLISLTVHGNTIPEINGPGNAIDFVAPDKTSVLRYSKLHVYDTQGSVLPSSLELADNSIIIRVNDASAVYPIIVDPLLSSPSWEQEGNQKYAHLGASVSTAGDVNGDGYSDVIIGAPYFDNGTTDPEHLSFRNGKVFVYYGSSSGLSTSVSWSATGDQTQAQFGYSVGAAGDVDGDGFGDIIIGAPFYTNGQTEEGMVFVFFGSATGLGPDAVPGDADWTAESDQADAGFGFSVGTAGDVNNDGYSDVVIGAPYYDNPEVDEGCMFLYYGSASGPAGAPWSHDAWTKAGAHMGYSVATAGDVNGDGYSDVIVGAPEYSYSTSLGIALVFSGSESGLSTGYSQYFYADEADARFGHSVGTAGDVDGNGYSDIIVGAPNYDWGRGEVCVFYYPTGSTWEADWALKAKTSEEDTFYGWSVATAGDVNGDGYADIVISAKGNDHTINGYTDVDGAAYVFIGSSTGLAPVSASTDAYASVAYNMPGYDFGVTASTAGDINGDGFSDILVGNPFHYNDQVDEGGVFVYQGAPAGLSESVGWADSGQSNSSFGTSLSTAGDVNGDGYDDIIVGAPYADYSESNEGRAYVYYGSLTGLSASPSWTAESNQASAYFGSAVASAGDVNGDGYDDIIIGANQYDNGGAAFVYHGSDTGLGPNGTPGNADWLATGSGRFGKSVATAGDVNGDGFSDVAIGDYYYQNGHTYEGGVFVYHGSASGLGANGTTSNADWKAEGEAASVFLGTHLGTAGDVNGDGYSDLIVGTLDERALVYHGSSSGLDADGGRPMGTPLNADWFDSYDGSYYGQCVSSAGDVNGDGYSDIVVGEYGYERLYDENTWRGRIHVYHGSSSGLSSSPDWQAEGDKIQIRFGYSVGTAGDVNGDGYSDIIVGAYSYYGDGLDGGAAFVYRGSPTGLDANGTRTSGTPSNADWSASGSTGYFGQHVGTAGDVNGDGFSDVIIEDGEFDEIYGFYGNSGRGVSIAPRQLQPGGTIPISRLGFTSAEGAFVISALGRTPMGRGKIKIEWEAKPTDEAFDGNGTSMSADWRDTGTAGYLFTEEAAGLFGHTNYRWRARFRYPAGNIMGQSAGPWFSPFPSNPEALDFRTSNNPPTVGFNVDNSIPAEQISQSSGGDGVITIHFRIKDEGRNFCTLERFYFNDGIGSGWVRPVDLDQSGSLGGGWPDKGGVKFDAYVDWTGTIHSFTFDTKHSDASGYFMNKDLDTVLVAFRANDGLSSSGYVYTEAFRVDNVPPTSGSITINDIDGHTNDSTPDITLSASGASHMRFALSEAGLSAATWVVYEISYSSFDISTGGNGEKTVWVEFKDECGNIQSTHVFDTTVYSTSPIVTGDAVTNDTTPTWTWSSGGDGSGSFRYKLDNSNLEGEPSTPETSYTPSGVLSEGEHTLYVQEWNIAGYWGDTGSFTIEIDSGIPCSEASSPEIVDDLNQTFTIAYTYDDIYAGETCGSADSGSGLATVHLWARAPGEDTYSLTDTDSGDDIDGQFSYTASDEGAYDFYTIATDNAGNVEPVSGSDTQTIYASQFSGYAIVAVGAVYSEEGIESHTLTANNVYKHLIDRNFALVDNPLDRWSDPLDHIKYFNPYSEDQIGEDDYTEGGSLSYWEAMQKAITQWALDKMTNLPGPLFITLIDHGIENYFYLENFTAITATNLNDWLNELETGLTAAGVEEDIVIILGSCYSGSFIDELSKPGRIIVAASAADEPSYRGPEEPVFGIRDGEFFTTSLFNELAKGKSLKESFLYAAERIEIHTDSGYGNNGYPYFDEARQHPFLDDDGVLPGSHELSPDGDGESSENIYLGYATDAVEPVEISGAIGYPDTVISSPSLLLWADVSNSDTVDRVWVEIREPDTTLEGGSEQQLVDLIELPMTLTGDRYEIEPVVFTEPGQYTLFFYVRDDAGFISPFKKTYVYRELTANSAPDEFDLVSPTNGATVPISLVLDWEDSQDSIDGDDISYIVTVSTDPDLSDSGYWVYREEGIENSTVSLSAEDGIENTTTYYWQVIAIDEYGEDTPSSVWEFTTDSVTNPVAGWIKGYVYDDVTSDFISDATVSVGGLSMNSALNGYYLGMLDAGGYSVTVSASGYEGQGPVSVTIPEGGILTWNFGLTPAADTQPVAAIISPASDVIITEGESVNFQGSVDSGDAPFTYLWDFDSGAVNSDQEDPGDTTFLTAGVYHITFTATDNDGDVSNDSVTVTVEADLCPGDPEKTDPGICGCGVPDIDTDDDGEMDCIDLDDDDDGMPDDWEEFYGLDPLFDDAYDDADNDGYSNLEEYALGSDPTNRNDPRPRAMPWIPLLLE